MIRARAIVLLVSIVFATVATDAFAAGQRTFVASAGSDANPCSLVLPCRSFGVAITQTMPGGEVIALDSAGYGPVVITQAVSIIAPSGVYAGISVPAAGVGVSVSAGASDLIVLRGLTMTAQTGAAYGIHVLSRSPLVVEGCEIMGPFSRGILAEVTVPVDILVKETHVTGAAAGVVVAADGVKLSVIDSVLDNVFDGIASYGDAEVVVDNVRLIGRGFGQPGSGIFLSPYTNGGRLHVAHALVSEFNNGVWAQGTNPNVSIAASELNRTYTAVFLETPGQVALTGNRLVHNTLMINVAAGTVTSSGTNYAADNGSLGGPIAGPNGLF